MTVEKKSHVWEVGVDNHVHTRWCPAVAEARDIAKVQPYYTVPKTALDLLTQIAAGDSSNQFGAENRGPSMLKPCAHCVLVLAEQEREDLP